MNPVRILLVLLALLALGAGVAVLVMLEQPPAIRTATVYPSPAALPDVTLLDTDGEPVGRGYFEGQLDLVFFGFTHCPDVCPTTLQKLSLVRQQLSARGVEPLPRVVLVSVDPERDTPDILAEYVGYFGDGVAGLTGDVGEIRRLADAVGVYFKKGEVIGEQYGVDHSGVVLVVNDRAEVVGLFAYPHDPAQIAADYPALLTL